MATKKRVALITGASRGIGLGIAKYLISKGYFVHCTYRNDKKLIDKAFGKEANATIHHLDVADENEVKKVLLEVKKISGGLHLLVNNAAVDYQATIEDMTLKQWNETFDARGTGTFLMTKYSIPLLKENKRSTIINITSSFAYEALPNFPAAGAAEAAKMSFTKTSAVALAKYGIRTHSVNPGVTRTPLWDSWGVDDKGWADMAKSNPLGRNCTPEDVARIIFYLDSEEAAYLNGAEIYTNGGNHLK
jgi:NAD(P)-dependent dehydrogenase (short-subunit alcohol dehydrogenase family)